MTYMTRIGTIWLVADLNILKLIQISTALHSHIVSNNHELCSDSAGHQCFPGQDSSLVLHLCRRRLGKPGQVIGWLYSTGMWDDVRCLVLEFVCTDVSGWLLHHGFSLFWIMYFRYHELRESFRIEECLMHQTSNTLKRKLSRWGRLFFCDLSCCM